MRGNQAGLYNIPAALWRGAKCSAEMEDPASLLRFTSRLRFARKKDFLDVPPRDSAYENPYGRSRGRAGDVVSKPTHFVQGTLDFLLLKILAGEPLHGFAIGRRLGQVSGGVLNVSHGSLYPALHKLEERGWINARWKPTENNRRAKFYAVTKLGRKHLEKETDDWDRLSTAIFAVMQLEEA